MTIPTKTSNLLSWMPDAMKKYIKDLDYDLQQLYSKFKTLISFNKVKVGSSDNYTQMDSNGTIRLYGTATTFTDYNVPLLTTKPTSAGKPDFDYTHDAYAFPQNDTSENLRIRVQMPHQWKIASTIFPHVHWLQGQNEIPVFKIDYKWYSNGADYSSTWSSYTISTTEYTYSSGTISQLSSNSVGIPGTGRDLSSVLKIRLYRDDNTYTGDCLVDDFDIHYEIDSLGSNSEFTK